MPSIAVFPGQGAQNVGMGHELYEQVPQARAVFDEVDDALGEKLSAVIFEGSTDELTLTANAQPALMATSLAAVRALEARLEKPIESIVAYAAGHSLGEYSALAAMSAISISDAARLLRVRGKAMQEAVAAGEGAMAAVLGQSLETVERVAQEAAQEGGTCEVANDNGEGQIVLSGDRAAVERACEVAKAHGAKRAMLLRVSAPFHCSLMRPAAERLARALAETHFRAPRRPVISNVTARPVEDPAEFPDLLERQMTAPVRWRETMQTMAELKIERVIEFGAGKVLTGLARRALPKATLVNLLEPADLDAFAHG